jgi:hypothetical protein
MKRRRKSAIERDLDQFVELLTRAAEAAFHDEDLDFDERLRFQRHGSIFSTSVAELKKIVGKDRLLTLYGAVGSAALIASHQMEDPIRNRRRAAPATQGQMKGRQERVRIAQDVAAKVERRPGEGSHVFKTRLHNQLSKQFPKLRRDTLARYLKS